MRGASNIFMQACCAWALEHAGRHATPEPEALTPKAHGMGRSLVHDFPTQDQLTVKSLTFTPYTLTSYTLATNKTDLHYFDEAIGNESCGPGMAIQDTWQNTWQDSPATDVTVETWSADPLQRPPQV